MPCSFQEVISAYFPNDDVIAKKDTKYTNGQKKVSPFFRQINCLNLLVSFNSFSSLKVGFSWQSTLYEGCSKKTVTPGFCYDVIDFVCDVNEVLSVNRYVVQFHVTRFHSFRDISTQMSPTREFPRGFNELLMRVYQVVILKVLKNTLFSMELNNTPGRYSVSCPCSFKINNEYQF